MPRFAVEYTYHPDKAAARDEHRPAHRAWLAAHADTGFVLSSGPYPDGSGALIIVDAADRQSVLAAFKEDPFARERLLADVRVIEWQPTIGAFADESS